MLKLKFPNKKYAAGSSSSTERIDPFGQHIVTADGIIGFAHVIRPSLHPHFSNLAKENNDRYWRDCEPARVDLFDRNLYFHENCLCIIFSVFSLFLMKVLYFSS